MKKRKIIIFSIILSFIFFLTLIFYDPESKETITKEEIDIKTEKDIYASNIIDNVNYSSNDADGNSYTQLQH